jgi:hypothetical protein
VFDFRVMREQRLALSGAPLFFQESRVPVLLLRLILSEQTGNCSDDELSIGDGRTRRIRVARWIAPSEKISESAFLIACEPR